MVYPMSGVRWGERLFVPSSSHSYPTAGVSATCTVPQRPPYGPPATISIVLCLYHRRKAAAMLFLSENPLVRYSYYSYYEYVIHISNMLVLLFYLNCVKTISMQHILYNLHSLYLLRCVVLCCAVDVLLCGGGGPPRVLHTGRSRRGGRVVDRRDRSGQRIHPRPRPHRKSESEGVGASYSSLM